MYFASYLSLTMQQRTSLALCPKIPRRSLTYVPNDSTPRNLAPFPLSTLQGVLPPQCSAVTTLDVTPGVEGDVLFSIGGRLLSDTGESVARTVLCTASFVGVRPVLAVTDARSPDRSTVALWKQLHLRELNSALNPALAAKGVPDAHGDRGGGASRKSVAFDLVGHGGEAYSTTPNLGSDDAVAAAGRSRAAGAGPNEIVLDLGSAAHLSDDTVVELALTNRSACTCSWSLALPADLAWQPELWAMPHNPTFTEDHHRLVQEHNIFEVAPKRGELAPGATCTITLTYRHGLVDRHSVPVLLTQPGTTAPPVRLRLVGETLAGGNPHLDFPAPTHRFEPVPLGLLEPPVQLYTLRNTSDVDAEFTLDLSAVEALRQANYGVPIFECGMASGVVPAQSSLILPWRFQPLEAKVYRVAVGVHVCNAPLSEEAFVLQLLAEGVDPRGPAGAAAAAARVSDASGRRRSSLFGVSGSSRRGSLLGANGTSVTRLVKRRRRTLTNLGRATPDVNEPRSGSFDSGNDAGLLVRAHYTLRRLNTLTDDADGHDGDSDFDEAEELDDYDADATMNVSTTAGTYPNPTARNGVRFSLTPGGAGQQGSVTLAAASEASAVDAPLKPVLVLDGQLAQLSHTRLDLGPAPLHAVLRRLVFVDNLLSRDHVRFRWHCGQYAGVMRVEPEEGEVPPGEAVACKVVFKPREGVRLYNFDVCCEVWNGTREAARAARLAETASIRVVQADYFTITDQGRTGRGRAGGYRGGGAMGDTSGEHAPADAFSGTLPVGVFPSKVLATGPAPELTGRLDTRPRSSGPRLQPVVGARSVIVNDTDLRTTKYQVRLRTGKVWRTRAAM